MLQNRHILTQPTFGIAPEAGTSVAAVRPQWNDPCGTHFCAVFHNGRHENRKHPRYGR